MLNCSGGGGTRKGLITLSWAIFLLHKSIGPVRCDLTQSTNSPVYLQKMEDNVPCHCLDLATRFVTNLLV